MARDFQPTIRTPNILVPSGDKDGLPNSQVLLRATSHPIRNGQPDGFECPWSFLSPPREILSFSLAIFVKIVSLRFLSESCGHKLVTMNYSGTRTAIDHLPIHRSEERRVGKECRSRW